MDELFADAQDRMDKAVEALKREFAKIRTGKATVSLLDGIKVEYYGSSAPIRQVANISVPEARLLVIKPWDNQKLVETLWRHANLQDKRRGNPYSSNELEVASQVQQKLLPER